MGWMRAGMTAALMMCGVAWAQQNLALLDDTWVANGPVYAVAATPAVTYIGGDFSYVGPGTGNGVPLDPGSGEATGAFPKVSGLVQACVPDGLGGWFIGGTFTQVGAYVRNNLAHIRYDGAVDTSWAPSVSGGYVTHVYALALSGATLFIGGNFTSVGGAARSSIAAVDVDEDSSTYGQTTSWDPNPLPTSDPNVYGYVSALKILGSTLYVGGHFTSLGGADRSNIGALSTSTGAATSWNPGANAEVCALDISVNPAAGTTIYVGGAFSYIAHSGRSMIAALDPDSNYALPWNPSANGTVRALAASLSSEMGLTVFVGGDFTNIGAQWRQYIAALDANLSSSGYGKARSWNPGANSQVYALALWGSDVYAGGNFTTMGGEARNHLAAIDTLSGEVADWNPSASEWVSVLTASDKVMYAGGAFTSVGGQLRNNLAAIEPTTGNATTWQPVISGGSYPMVYALAVSGSTVYVGGSFTSAGGQTRSNIAALDATTGAVTTWNPNANDDVVALAVSGTTVYAGGRFTTISGQTRNHIAALNTTTANGEMAWDPNADGEVSALAVAGSVLYTGGRFSTIGGQPRNNIAALDANPSSASYGNAISWDPNAGGDTPNVLALAVSGTTVYAAGAFTNMGGVARNRIAALDSATGELLDWNPNASDTVTSLAVLDTTVYAGGYFTSVSGQTRRGLVSLDANPEHVEYGNATSWNPNVTGGTYPYVAALSMSGVTLYAGGSFTNAKGLPCSNFAAFAPAPTVTVEQASVQGDPARSAPVLFDVSFSESISGLDASDIVQIGTAVVTFTVIPNDTDGAHYRIRATPTTDGTVQPIIPARRCVNDAGIWNTASVSFDNTVVFDTTGPKADQIIGSIDSPTAPQAYFQVHFDEDVTHFDAEDLVINTIFGSITYWNAIVTGGPQSYLVTIYLSTDEGVRNNGKMTLAVSTTTDVQDRAGNLITESVTSAPLIVGYVMTPANSFVGLVALVLLLGVVAVIALKKTRQGMC